MHTRLPSITNDLHYLGEVISLYKQVRKILGVLPKSQESKVDTITETKNLKTLTMYEVIRNLKTRELKKYQEQGKNEEKKEKSLVLRALKSDSNKEY